MAKRIRVGLYKLEYRSPDGKTIPDILSSIQALPDDETRAFMLAADPAAAAADLRRILRRGFYPNTAR